jgi:DNA-directed RNA polymerase specialized sigma24 family protein
MTVSLSELEAFVAGDEDVGSDFDAERLGCVISDFVRSLPDRRRFIFMSRYYLAEPIDTIAKDLSLSRSMINKELASIRNALRERLESEGYLI